MLIIYDLANNHILDHSPDGLKNTIEVCRRNGIDSKNRCRTRLNIIRCESLRDALITILEKRSGDIPE